MKEIMSFWPGLIAPLLFVLIILTGMNWATIINIMEKKYSIEEALAAFKKGATIYRVKGYSRYGSETRTANGKTKIVRGSLNDENEVDGGMCLNLESVMAEDWVIVWPKKEKE